jgi:hypothetical protein
MEMFPHVCFVLVDPAFSKPEHAHQVKRWDPSRVVVWKEMFNSNTVSIINAWRGLPDVKYRNAQFETMPCQYHPYFKDLDQLRLVNWNSSEDLLFISDVRLSAHNEDSIGVDMDMQSCWFHELHATNGLMKFRLPYVTKEWMANRNGHNCKRKYMEGDVYMPIWGPRSTTECRLFVYRGCGTKEYDPVLHENQFAGFNQLDRKMSYIYRGEHFKSFDEAATYVVISNYINYITEFTPPPDYNLVGYRHGKDISMRIREM